MEEIIVKVDGKEYKVKVEETPEGKLKIYCGGDVYEVEAKPVVNETHSVIEQGDIGGGSNLIRSPLPGVIVDIRVKNGQQVNAGESMIKIIAMKMENDITAPRNGKIVDVKVKKNDNVNRGDVLIMME